MSPVAEHHPFARGEVLPSWFVNAIQRFLAGAHTEFKLERASDTEIRVAPGTALEIAAVPIEGRWRYIEAAITRAAPGGAAGTYDVFAVALDNEIVAVPDPYTDATDYSFDLRIVAGGTTPSGAGVEIFEKVGEIEWNGAAITELEQVVSAVSGPMIAADALLSSDGTPFRRQANGTLAAPSGPWKRPVRAAAAGNVTVANPGTDTFDGVLLSNGDRLLLSQQTAAAENGIYVFNGSATALTRAGDADSAAEVMAGLTVYVSEGAGNGNKQFVMTADDPITLGTTPLTFEEAGGAGMQQVAITSDVAQDVTENLDQNLETLKMADGSDAQVVIPEDGKWWVEDVLMTVTKATHSINQQFFWELRRGGTIVDRTETHFPIHNSVQTNGVGTRNRANEAGAVIPLSKGDVLKMLIRAGSATDTPRIYPRECHILIRRVSD